MDNAGRSGSSKCLSFEAADPSSNKRFYIKIVTIHGLKETVLWHTFTEI